jgi:4-diphosphocytidyl-2-C-methyl-D-erythritol kinase
MTVTSSARAVTVRAHAKINLDLRVLGTRPDGFHELRTVFQALELHDTIECVPRVGPLRSSARTAGVPLDRSNLVWRAAEALWRSLRREGSVRDVLVRLHKRIPLQGGLGGGSADAAATLLALAHAWRLPIRPSQLVDVASALGADVPFFWLAARHSGLAGAMRSIRWPICPGTGWSCSFRVWCGHCGRVRLVRFRA